MKTLNVLAAVLVAILVVLGATIFTVDQRQYAIVFQLGEIRSVLEEPGLYFKWPMIQNVRYYDKRILTLESAEPERFLTSEKKNVLVDSFTKWRIIDPKLYYRSVAGDESRAKTRIAQTVNAGLREEFGKRTVHEVVSGERNQIMEQMRDKADLDARNIGVQIVDVRVKRVELPIDVSESVYRRMDAERKRVANELRSQGFAEAEKIRADADKQHEVIVAEAYRDAQKMKGEGDAKASTIYAQAFEGNAEFYAFYRSLEAYRGSFKGKSDVIVVEPSSDFFKYMKSVGRGGDKVGK
ncbi:Protein HflC [Candidatus Accumulibacter aalborgensis]|uniref:Protein HflC n=1 Tax=Candidatus Accumulibacter aalborgensis TaxID=1860102 RepID=A0A1A8XVV3_9PROT|nr:Protein HflC [Candidatus Accumulibacter aalborgensis]